MNKTILIVLIVFLSISLFATFASANEVQKLGCKCKSRSVLKCGLGKSDEAAICRKKYIESCRTRCTLLKKCATKIAEKCSSKKQGSVEFKKCERTTAATYCISEIDKTLIKDCKCKKFARALCGTSNGKDFTLCRDKAEDECRKKCGPIQECTHKKRICISQNKCACKSISKTKCAKSEDYETCYANELKTCTKKCVATTRCFPLSCKKAGFKRCDRAVKALCNKYEFGSEEHTECITKKTVRCQAYELATCKRARRLFRYRAECSEKAEKKCGKFNGAEKCNCVSVARKGCLIEKIKHRKIFIRHQKSCTLRAKLLCDEKNCEDVKACYKEETKRCHRRCKRRHDIVPPTCVDKVHKLCGNTEGKCYKKHIKRCTTLWLRRYCEHRSFESCDGDFECMKVEILKCKKTLPKCWNDRSLCCDKNKCTTDICHPTRGCINVPKDCNDKNLCTIDTCDSKKGCVHTAVDCDDDVDCTIDTCNYKNGQCEHICDHAKCENDEQCTTPICDSKRGCIYHKDFAKCKRHNCGDLCEQQCTPRHKCEKVECTCDEDLSVKCERKHKNCDDKKKCTVDFCDKETGKCIHREIKNEECEILCEKNQDCSSFAEKHHLAKKCKVAVCDSDLGACKAVDDLNKKCVPQDKCHEVCKPRNACDIKSRCTKDETGNIVCERPEPCDDGIECTIDKCNEKTGTCEHDTRECKNFCEKDLDCAEWGVKERLAERCEEPFCNKKKGSCEKKDLPGKPHCQRQCDVTCIAKDKCEEAKCVGSPNGWFCQRTKISCDDKNRCTLDYCDASKGCLHKSIKCIDCPDCEAKDKCEIAECIKNESGDFKCVRSAKSCDDKNPCTNDICDAKIGCVNTLRDDCFKCHEKCHPRHKCETAKCVATESAKGFKCVYETISCSDNDKCTIDHCDIETGKCVHTAKRTCKLCKLNCEENNKCSKCIKTDDGNDWKCGHSDRHCDDEDDCTIDYCDSEKGCVHKLKKDIAQCKPCVDEEDCHDLNASLAKSCKKAICNKEKGHCSIVDKKNKSKCQCTKNCFAKNACEEVSCEKDSENRSICKRVVKVCNDGIDCTRDYCDTKTGKCRHISVNCCTKDEDCSKLDSKVQKVCKKARCDLKTRRCKVEKDTSKQCSCPIDCVPGNACQQAECDLDKDSNPICVRRIKSCDDANVCTVDHCDEKTGQCVNTKISGCCTETDQECSEWSKKHIRSNCHEAKCDIERGRCVSVPVENPPAKCTPICDNCQSQNPCQTADCVPNDDNTGSVCVIKFISCNDNNPCTTDQCDSETGECVHTKIDSPNCKYCLKDSDCPAPTSKCQVSVCDANSHTCQVQNQPDSSICPCDLNCVAPNPCQKAYCDYGTDGKPYCAYTNATNCYDNNECTLDYCNILTGDCVHVSKISDKCTPCEDKLDCATWGSNRNLASKCQEPVCDTEKGICIARDIQDKSKCCKDCSPRNACESSSCVINSNGKPVCKRVFKNCDDGIDCTRDFCDLSTGKCVHVEQNCCNSDEDCSKLDAKVRKSCKKATCNLRTRRCKVEKDTSRKCTGCPLDCVPGNACQQAECALDKDSNPICVRRIKSCDDANVCTVDHCDETTGQCVNTKINGCCLDKENCPIQTCKKDKDCSKWAIKKDLAKDCKEAKCDLELGRCVSFKSADQSKCQNTPPPPPPPTCDNCKPANLCQTADCVPTDDNNGVVCVKKDISCDDFNDCTTDSCNTETGVCVHTQIDSPKCHFCAQDSDCKLPVSACQFSFCDNSTHTCQVKRQPDSSICPCDLNCATNSPCQKGSCEFGTDGKPTCVYTNTTCFDNNPCTDDYCNLLTGDCVFVTKLTKECYPCDQTTDCVKWGNDQQLSLSCQEPLCNNATKVCIAVDLKDKTGCGCPNCVSSPCVSTQCIQTAAKTFTCKSTPKNCDDGIACTLDSCNSETGECVHTPVNINCNDNDNCTIDTCDASKGCLYTSVPPSPQCVKCAAAKDCSHYALTHNLSNQCVFCNKNKHCSPKQDEKLCAACDCPQQPCSISTCSFDENGKPVCTYKAKSCYDGIDCTVDTCDKNTGLCVNTPRNNTKLCNSHLNCLDWFQNQDISDKQCKKAVCSGGCCKAVLNTLPCNVTCPPNLNCQSAGPCEQTYCALDKTGNYVCLRSTNPSLCDDGNVCTVDTCDLQSGLCKHSPAPGITNTCSGTCCIPPDRCHTSTLVTAENGTCYCKVSEIVCNDGINCTVDTCDVKTGSCKNTFVPSDLCPAPCTNDVQCFLWGHRNSLSKKCQDAVCNVTLGACQAVDDVECHNCKKSCTAKNACEIATCVKVGIRKYKCNKTQKVVSDCNDHKSCTVDYLDTKTCQCVNNNTCLNPCNKDLDCNTWAAERNLYANCSHAVCDLKSGSCHAVPDLDTSRCNTTCRDGTCSVCTSGNCTQCTYNSDCPQNGHGSVCYNGKCITNNCTTSFDCVASSVPGQLTCSCVANTTTGSKNCYCDKCNSATKTCNCDDKNVCTKDLFLPQYEFCEHFPRCDDHNACTFDLCIPSADGKSYTCSHTSISCSINCTLAKIPLDQVPQSQKADWLGKCDKNFGCQSCCSTGQCFDRNGCANSDCVNQQCQAAPIDNQWCDPVVSNQPINFQSIPGLRDKLALAGYDIAALGE